MDLNKPTKKKAEAGDRDSPVERNLTPAIEKSSGRDSPVERNLSNDESLDVTASRINRMHLDTQKLSGAARRRLKRALMKEGTDVRNPHSSGGAIRAGPGTFKRTRTSVDTPPSDRGKPVKRPRGTEPGVSYREALSAFKMAIIGENHPEEKLIEEDIRLIQAVILGKLDEAPDESLPRLRSFSLQDGALVYYCDDQQSANWLQKNIQGARIKENTILKVVDPKDLPKPVKVALRTRDVTTVDTKALLGRIQRLNQGLNTVHWKIIDKQADSSGQRLILMVDQESAKKITELGLSAYTGVDRAFFKILSDPDKKTDPDKTKKAGSDGGADPETMETRDSGGSASGTA